MPTQFFSVVPSKAWLLLTAGPALFLLGIVGVSIFLSLREVPVAQIPERVTALVPHILLGMLVCLALTKQGTCCDNANIKE